MLPAQAGQSLKSLTPMGTMHTGASHFFLEVLAQTLSFLLMWDLVGQKEFLFMRRTQLSVPGVCPHLARLWLLPKTIIQGSKLPAGLSRGWSFCCLVPLAWKVFAYFKSPENLSEMVLRTCASSLSRPRFPAWNSKPWGPLCDPMSLQLIPCDSSPMTLLPSPNQGATSPSLQSLCWPAWACTGRDECVVPHSLMATWQASHATEIPSDIFISKGVQGWKQVDMTKQFTHSVGPAGTQECAAFLRL